MDGLGELKGASEEDQDQAEPQDSKRHLGTIHECFSAEVSSLPFACWVVSESICVAVRVLV